MTDVLLFSGVLPKVELGAHGDVQAGEWTLDGLSGATDVFAHVAAYAFNQFGRRVEGMRVFVSVGDVDYVREAIDANARAHAAEQKLAELRRLLQGEAE